MLLLSMLFVLRRSLPLILYQNRALNKSILNQNERPLAYMEGGTYNGMAINVSNHFAINADKNQTQQQGCVVRQFKVASDNEIMHIHDTTN